MGHLSASILIYTLVKQNNSNNMIYTIEVASYFIYTIKSFQIIT